jgi:import inner membrane translocase subunit TIM10
MFCGLCARLSRSCHSKCIPPRYSEGELSKGEAVCLDRCVAKFLEIHDRIGKKLTAMYMQEQATMKQMQAQQQR